MDGELHTARSISVRGTQRDHVGHHQNQSELPATWKNELHDGGSRDVSGIKSDTKLSLVPWRRLTNLPKRVHYSQSLPVVSFHLVVPIITPSPLELTGACCVKLRQMGHYYPTAKFESVPCQRLLTKPVYIPLSPHPSLAKDSIPHIQRRSPKVLSSIIDRGKTPQSTLHTNYYRLSSPFFILIPPLKLNYFFDIDWNPLNLCLNFCL